MVGVDDTPTTDALSPGPAISLRKQLGSASGRGLETQTTVGDHAVLMIVRC